MVLLELVTNLATNWPPGGTTCIITVLPGIALLASLVSIELDSSPARVTSVKSPEGVVWTSIYPEVYLSPIEIVLPNYHTE